MKEIEKGYHTHRRDVLRILCHDHRKRPPENGGSLRGQGQHRNREGSRRVRFSRNQPGRARRGHRGGWLRARPPQGRRRAEGCHPQHCGHDLRQLCGDHREIPELIGGRGVRIRQYSHQQGQGQLRSESRLHLRPEAGRQGRRLRRSRGGGGGQGRRGDEGWPQEDAPILGVYPAHHHLDDTRNALRHRLAHDDHLQLGHNSASIPRHVLDGPADY